jgi:hypothetical protein
MLLSQDGHGVREDFFLRMGAPVTRVNESDRQRRLPCINYRVTMYIWESEMFLLVLTSC